MNISLAQTVFKPIHEISIRVEPLPMIKGNLYGEVEWRPITPISFSYDWGTGRDWNHQPINTMLFTGFDVLRPHRSSYQMRIHVWEYDDDQWYGMYLGYSENRTVAIAHKNIWWGLQARKFEMNSLDWGFNILSHNSDNRVTVNSQIGFQHPISSRTLDALWTLPDSWVGVDDNGALVTTASDRLVERAGEWFAVTENEDFRFMTFYEDEDGLAGYDPYPFRWYDGFVYVKINIGIRTYPTNILKQHRRSKYLKARYGSAWRNYM
jgi:hypothetical protein